LAQGWGKGLFVVADQDVSSDSQGTSPDEETIELQQFLKLASVVQSGGEAKQRIRSGDIRVNGVVETRRGRKLRSGDRVEVDGEEYVIETDSDPPQNRP
jgi:ribosome-associated protein